MIDNWMQPEKRTFKEVPLDVKNKVIYTIAEKFPGSEDGIIRSVHGESQSSAGHQKLDATFLSRLPQMTLD